MPRISIRVSRRPSCLRTAAGHVITVHAGLPKGGSVLCSSCSCNSTTRAIRVRPGLSRPISSRSMRLSATRQRNPRDARRRPRHDRQHRYQAASSLSIWFQYIVFIFIHSADLRVFTDTVCRARRVIVRPRYRGYLMQDADWVERLNKAQRAVMKGEKQIRHQRALVDRLERSGKDASAARALLRAVAERQCGYHTNLASVIREFPGSEPNI